LFTNGGVVVVVVVVVVLVVVVEVEVDVEVVVEVVVEVEDDEEEEGSAKRLSVEFFPPAEATEVSVLFLNTLFVPVPLEEAVLINVEPVKELEETLELEFS